MESLALNGGCLLWVFHPLLNPRGCVKALTHVCVQPIPLKNDQSAMSLGGPWNRQRAKHQFVWIKQPILPGSGKLSSLCFKGGANEATSPSFVWETWCGVNYCDLKPTVNQLDISTRLSGCLWELHLTTNERLCTYMEKSSTLYKQL